jgi:hypothetical protein
MMGMTEQNEVMRRAQEAFETLDKKPNTFINIILDDWRGCWRFVYDTEEVRGCSNQCGQCKLFALLRDEKEESGFSAALLPANEQDKIQFRAKQNFLNCKTLDQYRDCYVDWLLKRADTEEKIRKELSLVKLFRIIFSKETSDLSKKENEFRESILENVRKHADESKRVAIDRIWNEVP